jgi:hypothetical protein
LWRSRGRVKTLIPVASVLPLRMTVLSDMPLSLYLSAWSRANSPDHVEPLTRFNMIGICATPAAIA